jgi:hypothetical protein
MPFSLDPSVPVRERSRRPHAPPCANAIAGPLPRHRTVARCRTYRQPQDRPRRHSRHCPLYHSLGTPSIALYLFSGNLNRALMALYLQTVGLRPHVAAGPPVRPGRARTAGGPAGHMTVLCNAAPGCRSVWCRPRAVSGMITCHRLAWMPDLHREPRCCGIRRWNPAGFTRVIA